MTDARVERMEPDPWLAAGFLDEARAARNEVSYQAGLAALPDVEETAAAVREFLTLIEKHVTPHLPNWQAES